MNSLREEISEIISFINGFKDGEFYNKGEGIEDILKLIEKRIDEKIKHIESLPDFYNDTAYEYGRRVLVQVKELLK